MSIANKKSRFTFVTWNIDGLDDRNIKERTMEVINTIQTKKLDIVFLQEIISETYELIKSYLLSDYHLTENKAASSEDQWYFTIILLKRTRLNLRNVKMISFDNSAMGRDLTVVDAKFQNGPKLMLVTTHLESMKQFSKERIEQLKIAFELVKDTDENSTVLFAGDLNVRDSEVERVGVPWRVDDVWIRLGAHKECQFTWDLTVNTNKKNMDKKKPRFRFDRVYYRPSAKNEIKPLSFKFCGTEKVPSWKCFPSDHFGIICEFEFNKEPPD